MARAKRLLERYSMLERLTIRGYASKHGIHYLFSVGRYSNAVVAKYDNRYHYIIFKTNKTVHPGLWGTQLSDDPKASMIYWKAEGLREGILKHSEFGLSGSEFLHDLVNQHGVSPATMFKMFPELEATRQDNIVEIDKFKFVYLSEKEIPTVESILKEASKILSKHGFGKLLYGNIYSTPTLSRNVLASYTINTDSVMVTNKAKKDVEAARFMIHELGHRLWYKFMNEAQKKEVQDKYYEVVSNDQFKVKVGDKFKAKDGKELEVVEYKIKRDIKYVFIEDGHERPRFEATKDYFRKLKLLNREQGEQNIFDVSPYARTDATEFFPEVFSFALVGKDKTLLDWIKKFK